MTRALSQHPYPVDLVNRPASRRLPLHEQVRRHAELALRLSSAIDAATSVQYTRGEFSGIRSEAVGYDDPAGETAVNGPRLQVSSKIRVAERALEETARVLERCLLHLEAAVDKHQGGEDEDPLPFDGTGPYPDGYPAPDVHPAPDGGVSVAS